MKDRLRNRGRVAIMRFGNRWGARVERRIKTLHRYLDLGMWSNRTSGELPPHWDRRSDLFHEALRHVHGEQPLYLEFGVYKGESFTWWCENLTSPDARLVGFDSFEGLPEDWHEHMKAGAFAMGGRAPEISDPRASFEIGWFDETLPSFKLPDHDQLIVSIDSDLYSSAAFVLSELEPHLVPGTLIYFDELSDRDHELRAWREFLDRTSSRFEPLGMANGGVNWLFRLIA